VAAEEPVVPPAAEELIVACPADNLVVTSSAAKDVGSGPAVELVVPGVAPDDVRSASAAGDIVALARKHDVRAAAGGDGVVPAETLNQGCARRTQQRVVPVRPGEDGGRADRDSRESHRCDETPDRDLAPHLDPLSVAYASSESDAREGRVRTGL